MNTMKQEMRDERIRPETEIQRGARREPDRRAEGAEWDKEKWKETKDTITNFKTALKAVKGKTKL